MLWGVLYHGDLEGHEWEKGIPVWSSLYFRESAVDLLFAFHQKKRGVFSLEKH